MSKYLSILFLLLWGATAFAQTKTSLEEKRKKLLEEINYTQKTLEKTKASRQATLNDLSAIQKQISLRQKLINNTESEVHEFEDQISVRQRELERLQQLLESQRSAYAESIAKTYRYQRFTNKLLFIASAKSFAESLRRVNYMRRFAIHKLQQFEEIQATQALVAKNIAEIDGKKDEKEKVLNEQLAQKRTLDKDRKKKDQIVKNLKSQESKLASTLAKKKKDADKLDKQIEAAIQKEIAAAKKKAEDEAKKAAAAGKPANTPVASTSKSEVKTSNTPAVTVPHNAAFASLRGKLPWPVDKGFISRSFGTYSNPDLPNVKFENNGVDIRTDAGISVKAVFGGKVVGIINNPTYKNAVIVSHGDYFSVYSKLSSVNVSANQQISARDKIGTAYTDAEQNLTEVHLEIWRGAQKLNPADWLAPK